KGVKDSIADKLGLSVHGFVGASYNYNFNSPDSHTNQIRVFDTEANTFTLDQANLQISRKKEDSNLGFVVNMDFGKVAEIVGNASRWSNNPTSSESTNSFELREAYITYKLPVGGINLKAGRFVTLLGAEIIDNYDNHNFNVSRSFSFGYAIPFTHTGLLANIPLGDVVAVDLGIINGWDDVVDKNDGKSLLAGIAINPADLLSIYISGTYGAEQSSRGGSKRGTTTAVVTLKPSDTLTLALEGTYGNESDLLGANLNKAADWYGSAAYVVVKATDALSFALRGEVFDDPDGVRTGIAATGFGPGATLWEVTPTLAYQVTDGLLWRTEYRHDEADKRAFQHDSNLVRGQDTITTQLIYSF
ncbi:MAG: porin, partial [Deltaproteobacteria bacterium]|nr:porin [Deltaproteobacteria bacterium]